MSWFWPRKWQAAIRDCEAELKICYEATYVGFRLQRDLEKRGYHCDVIAPPLTPRKPGERVKTDRLDSRKLAEYYQRGLLTLVHIPDEAKEKVRGLIRSREFLVGQLKALKKHLMSNCRCMGLDYRRRGTGGTRFQRNTQNSYPKGQFYGERWTRAFRI